MVATYRTDLPLGQITLKPHDPFLSWVSSMYSRFSFEGAPGDPWVSMDNLTDSEGPNVQTRSILTLVKHYNPSNHSMRDLRENQLG